jgi:hypothetical protein
MVVMKLMKIVGQKMMQKVLLKLMKKVRLKLVKMVGLKLMKMVGLQFQSSKLDLRNYRNHSIPPLVHKSGNLL